MAKISVLFIGESWFVDTVETKGFDSFTVHRYEEGVDWIRDALRDTEIDFTYIPSHRVEYDFPKDSEALSRYDVIMLSDVGSNTFLLPQITFLQGEPSPNKLEMMKAFVRDGGGLCMIGGYMTFQGIDGKANYRNTCLAEVLPVTMSPGDDRKEIPEGFRPHTALPEHPVMRGISGDFPFLLGYNRLAPKEDAQVIACNGADPIIAAGTFGGGRTLAFACDCAPHWAPLDFCRWEHYPTLWQNIVRWLGQADEV